MLGAKENEVVIEKTFSTEVAVLTALGGRDSQQDSFGMLANDECSCIVICDGMGGYHGGEIVSKAAAEYLIGEMERIKADDINPEKLTWLMIEANNRVNQVKKERNIPTAGTTAVLVVVSREKMYWCSVGDSRAYIYRNNKYSQITQDQNYKTVLNGQLKAGLITRETYEQEISKGDSLINYLGLGELELIDYNHQAFEVKSGDKILLMTDGLYRFSEEKDIFGMVENFRNVEELLIALNRKAERKAQSLGVSRDNLTVGLIGIR